MDVWMGGWMYVCIDELMYGCMEICMYVFMYVWMYVCMYVCMYICTIEKVVALLCAAAPGLTVIVI